MRKAYWIDMRLALHSIKFITKILVTLLGGHGRNYIGANPFYFQNGFIIVNPLTGPVFPTMSYYPALRVIRKSLQSSPLQTTRKKIPPLPSSCQPSRRENILWFGWGFFLQ